MTSLSDRLDQYVTERRRYGGNWTSSAKQVRPFATFADSEGAEWITTGLFLRWKERFGNANQTAWAGRLSAVRVFAAWLQGIDPRTEVPPKGLISRQGCRPKPYIYSDLEIRRIVAEAARLGVPHGAARLDLFHDVRADRRHRHAHRRGARAARCGRGHRRRQRPGQAREEWPGSRHPDHGLHGRTPQKAPRHT